MRPSATTLSTACAGADDYTGTHLVSHDTGKNVLKDTGLGNECVSVDIDGERFHEDPRSDDWEVLSARDTGPAYTHICEGSCMQGWGC